MENTFSFTTKEIEILNLLVQHKLWIIESQNSMFEKDEHILIALRDKLKHKIDELQTSNI